MRTWKILIPTAFSVAVLTLATDEFSQDKGTEADAIEAIKLCLEQSLDINAFNDVGHTALHRA
jgi:ankyrin repeat protein